MGAKKGSATEMYYADIFQETKAVPFEMFLHKKI